MISRQRIIELQMGKGFLGGKKCVSVVNYTLTASTILDIYMPLQ